MRPHGSTKPASRLPLGPAGRAGRGPRGARSPSAAVAVLAAALAATTLPVPGSAQETDVPRFAEVAGHDLGERATLHGEMERYLERLAATSARVRLLDQGRSWEGRRLLAAIVTAPENHGRLESIRETAGRLADPRLTAPAEVEGLISDQPVVAWMGGSIHGNELSGTEGLLKLLEHLTRRDDPATLEVLRDVVVIVDPMLNPDGRDAFAVVNRRRRGGAPNPDRRDWNNDYTGWEGTGFRTGHYNFDTNRDWFAHTQRESRARAATIVAWHPQVSVDAHEMGSDVEFYFDPADEPYGPFFPEQARRWFDRFGEAYAAAFDSAGIEYMTRERYNYFYPGYTTSYSSYQGSVGMLYEQGSSRGPAVERPDGTVRTLADALEHQYVAAWTALRTSVERREELLREYHEAHRGELDDPGPGPRRYLIPPAGDPGLRAELGRLLLRSGIEVGVLREETRLEGPTDRAGRAAAGRSLPPGTWVVEASQPRSRLVRALLEPEVPLPEAFLREARERVERDENPRFYDITAWSLPLLFDLEAFGAAGAGSLPADPLTPEAVAPPPAGRLAGAADPTSDPHPSSSAIPRAGYAYLLDGRNAASVAAAYHLAHRGIRTAMLARSSRIAGRDVPAGTVLARVGEGGDAATEAHEAVSAVSATYGIEVRPVDTGLADPGFPSLGSADVVPIRAPRVALVAEGPVHGYSFGWAWYTLEEQHRIPTTVLRVGSLASTPLQEFDTLVLPDLFSASGLAAELGEEGMDRLRRWVRDGGTLVAIGEAVSFTRDTLGLLGLRSWYETEEGEEARRFSVPGSILTGRVDTLRWLAAGLPAAELPVLVASSRVLLPPEGPPERGERVVVRYADEGLRLSGHLWAESEARLPGAAFLYEERVGAGRVIAFAEDPNFRGYWRGANRLFLNAVVVGPSAP